MSGDELKVGLFNAVVKYDGKTKTITDIPTLVTLGEFKAILEETIPGLKFGWTPLTAFYGPRVFSGTVSLSGENELLTSLMKTVLDENEFTVKNAIKWEPAICVTICCCICFMLIAYLVI